MSQNPDNILRNAEAALKASAKTERPERIRACQDFLKVETRRLQSMHRTGAGGCEIARGLGAMMDTLLRHLFTVTSQSSPTKSLPISLVATGGYGRGELNPFSDVDILFLIPADAGPAMPEINAVVEQVLYALWDLGLKVGHATRTANECVAQAARDMQSCTALVEARYLDGTKKIFAEFQELMQRNCIDRRAGAYITERIQDQAQRHTKYGGTVFVQEPNVKNGCGGLRDLQSLLWIARFKDGTHNLADLRQRGALAEIESGRLTRAYDFLMRVRNQLHYTFGRAMDEITLAVQPAIAEALGYRQRDVLRRVEAFMRDYYRHARDIFILTEALAERLAIEQENRRGFRRIAQIWSVSRRRRHLEGGLILHRNVLECAHDSSFPQDAHDLMKVFHIAQIHGARIGAGLQSLIRQNLRLMNREYLYSTRARDLFLSILSRKGEVGRTLRMMHECGFLGQYLPEFGQLDCLVQHEFYHRYTADEHTLLACEKLDETLDATSGVAASYSRLFQQLENAPILYLAILLHDTGKSSNESHHHEASAECAQRVARRLCLAMDSRRTLIWLVDHHMSMSSLASRRDIEDPSTTEDFMKLTGTQERLDMLHLLTFVDAQAVGSPQWNEWRQALVWQLYRQTTRALGASGVERLDTETQQAGLRRAVEPKLLSHITSEELDSHFASMPPRYWHRVDKEELLWHLEALHAFFEGLMSPEHSGAAPIVRWRHFPDRGYSEAVVCSWDRHGLFAKIAGSFSAARINILSADIYTRSDHLVLDIFQVCDTDHRAVREAPVLRKISKTLEEALSDTPTASLPDLIREEYASLRKIPHQGEERFPTTIVFNHEDSDDYTILEIQTPDRLGLLYHILDVLSRCDLNIGLARINTEKGAAMDVFYLTDTEGHKLADEARLQSIRQKLHEAIDQLNEPYRRKT